MINRQRVDYLPPDLEVPEHEELSAGGDLQAIEGGRPELNQKNFARLCRKVTEIQMNRQKTLDEIENKLDDIEKRLDDIESVVSNHHNIKSDIQDVARIISTLKTEAIELEPIKP